MSQSFWRKKICKPHEALLTSQQLQLAGCGPLLARLSLAEQAQSSGDDFNNPNKGMPGPCQEESDFSSHFPLKCQVIAATPNPVDFLGEQGIMVGKFPPSYHPIGSWEGVLSGSKAACLSPISLFTLSESNTILCLHLAFRTKG